jgi:hypothetical protein
MYKLTIGPQRYFDAAEMTNRQHRFVVDSIGKAYISTCIHEILP